MCQPTSLLVFNWPLLPPTKLHINFVAVMSFVSPTVVGEGIRGHTPGVISGAGSAAVSGGHCGYSELNTPHYSAPHHDVLILGELEEMCMWWFNCLIL